MWFLLATRRLVFASRDLTTQIYLTDRMVKILFQVCGLWKYQVSTLIASLLSTWSNKVRALPSDPTNVNFLPYDPTITVILPLEIMISLHLGSFIRFQRFQTFILPMNLSLGSRQHLWKVLSLLISYPWKWFIFPMHTLHSWDFE